MASYTIEPRPHADGSVRYRTVVRVKEHGVIVYRESRTFSKQVPAKSWGISRVSHIEENGIPKER